MHNARPDPLGFVTLWALGILWVLGRNCLSNLKISMYIPKASDKLVRFVSIVIFTAWLLIILLTCILVFGDELYGVLPIIDKYILHLIGFDFAFNIFAFVLMQFPECKICGKKVFEETPYIKKNANYWSFVNGWSAVVVQIVTKNQFICMHCGKTVSLKKSTKR